MANYVGIDMGPTQVRILEAEGSVKKLNVTRFRRVDIRTADEALASSFLSKEHGDLVDEAMREAKVSREPVAMSWNSDHTIFRELDLPFTSDEQIRRVIKYEAESHLLNCDIDDVVVSSYKLREEREKSHLMVMAVRKDHLLNRFEVLSRAGVDPLMVDLDVMSTFNAISGLGYAEENGSFVVLDCGRRTTNLLLVSEGRLVSGRAIRLGSDSVAARLAADLGGEALAGDAAQLLEDRTEGDLVAPVVPTEPPETEKSSGELAQGIAADKVGDYYGKLSREVKRTLAVSRLPESFEIEKILITGPGSRLAGFAEEVAEKLGIDAPVERLDWLDRVEHSLVGDDAQVLEDEGLTSLGLAYKLAGHDATGIDFRQEECRYARRFDQVKEPAIYFCGFLLFLVLLWNLFDVRSLSVKTPFLFKTKSADIARIHKPAFDLYRAAMGKDAVLPEKYSEPSKLSINHMRQRMQIKIDDLKSQLGRGGAIPELPSALIMWRDCFAAIQKRMDAIGKLLLEDMTIVVRQQQQPVIELTGNVTSNAALDQLIGALNEIEGIEEVVRPTTRATSEFVNFTGLKVVYPKREEY
ncbi:MAG: pilus assembly protein PilM [Planctomycetota bacterium JB042]